MADGAAVSDGGDAVPEKHFLHPQAAHHFGTFFFYAFGELRWRAELVGDLFLSVSFRREKCSLRNRVQNYEILKFINSLLAHGCCLGGCGRDLVAVRRMQGA